MKTKVFIIAVVLVSPLLLCNGNSYGEAPGTEKSTDTLYFMGSRHWQYVTIGEKKIELLPPMELAFTGEDIKYFNLTTEEIVFNNGASFIESVAYHYYIYNIYLNDKLLLENIPVYTLAISWCYNDLVFCIDFDKETILYLNDGYPSQKVFKGVSLGEQMEECQKIRDENAQKRKEGWDIFIKYLSDAGKIVGGTAIERPPTTPELNTISIYPNPTKGELRIRN